MSAFSGRARDTLGKPLKHPVVALYGAIRILNHIIVSAGRLGEHLGCQRHDIAVYVWVWRQPLHRKMQSIAEANYSFLEGLSEAIVPPGCPQFLYSACIYEHACTQIRVFM